MKKLVVFLALAFIFVSTDRIFADDSPAGSSFNGNGMTEEEKIENEKAIKEKEADLSKKGLLIDDDSGIVPLVTLKEGASVGPQNTINAAGYYTTKKLNVKRVQQSNGYFCGPAATKMVLDYKGINMSQSAIATQLGTTSANGTSTSKISSFLKSKTGYNYVTQSISSRPISNVKTTIDANHPVIYNVKSRSLNDKYSFNSGHFVTGHGYRTLTDPNTSISRVGVSTNSVSLNANGVTFVVDLYYFDPWRESFAFGEKTVSRAKLTAAITANYGYYVW